VSRSGRRAAEFVGLTRRKRDRAPCGLCGINSTLTKTHVPPQCAGNTGANVKRVQVIIRNGPAEHSTPLDGGLHVYGLCRNCNALEAKYDSAYGELAKHVGRLWLPDLRTPVDRSALPQADVSPGQIIRSILIAFYGVDPDLRVKYPALARQLLSEACAIEPPADLRLHLALARGVTGLLTGPTVGFFGRRIQGRDYGISNHAQVYLPPLAWQLTRRKSSRPPFLSLLDLERWRDVTAWLTEPVTARKSLNELCAELPMVIHPRHDPRYAENWNEMYSNRTVMMESLSVSRSMLG
jgi:hypothetical protein